MKVPFPMEIVNLGRIIPLNQEMLDFCASTVLESATRGSIDYDVRTDEMTYHLVLTDDDRELFGQYLRGVEEIWIITRTRRDS